jgi:hypothetical protein
MHVDFDGYERQSVFTDVERAGDHRNITTMDFRRLR